VPLDKAGLDEAFDLRRSLRHTGRVLDALAGVATPEQFATGHHRPGRDPAAPPEQRS